MKPGGKVAIVTGASRGIGRHLVLALGRQGVRVALAVRTVTESVEEALAAIESAGSKGIAILTDLTKVEDLENLVATTTITFGRVDMLVNSAADIPGEMARIDQHTREGWLRQFNVNVHAPFTLMGLVAPHMRSQGGGVIVNLASSAAEMRQGIGSKPTAAMQGGPVLGYGTTKAAMNRLTNLVAHQLHDDRIAVLSVNPGFTRTEGVDQLITSGQLDTQATPHSMDLPVDVIMDIIMSAEPMDYSGRIIRATEHKLTAIGG